MKRHTSLEPFSRDHNDGLILARKLSIDGAAALPLFKEAWNEELSDHFVEEERLLGPLCREPDLERLISEHRQIEELGRTATRDPDARRLGKLLHDHIRWEERELFPTLEGSAFLATLASLGQAAEPLERRRGKANPKRAELVSRRSSHRFPFADLNYLAAIAKLEGPQWGIETEDLNATLLAWTEGQGIQEHVNDEVDVLVVVVAGELLLQIDGEEFRLGPGQVGVIPKGSARLLVAVTPHASHLNIHKRRKKLMPGLRP